MQLVTFDIASYLSLTVLAAFVSGMVLPAQVFRTIIVSNKLIP